MSALKRSPLAHKQPLGVAGALSGKLKLEAARNAVPIGAQPLAKALAVYRPPIAGHNK